MGGRVETEIKLRISCFDNMKNYQLFKKFMLLENGEFNSISMVNFL